jgi:hypothetical protein
MDFLDLQSKEVAERQTYAQTYMYMKYLCKYAYIQEEPPKKPQVDATFSTRRQHHSGVPIVSRFGCYLAILLPFVGPAE